MSDEEECTEEEKPREMKNVQKVVVELPSSLIRGMGYREYERGE